MVDVLLEYVPEDIRTDLVIVGCMTVIQMPVECIKEFKEALEWLVWDVDGVSVEPFYSMLLEDAAVQIGYSAKNVACSR